VAARGEEVREPVGSRVEFGVRHLSAGPDDGNGVGGGLRVRLELLVDDGRRGQGDPFSLKDHQLTPI
jgi:hypothetical protein